MFKDGSIGEAWNVCVIPVLLAGALQQDIQAHGSANHKAIFIEQPPLRQDWGRTRKGLEPVPNTRFEECGEEHAQDHDWTTMTRAERCEVSYERNHSVESGRRCYL